MTWSVFILILINIFNFDHLIYSFKKAPTGQGIDYKYLTTLSADSLSYKDQFLKLKEEAYRSDFSKDAYFSRNPFTVLRNIEYLKHKYIKVDLRSLNLMEYLQYRDIKSIDTNELRTLTETLKD